MRKKMTYKELMFKSLTDSLEKNEKLLFPVYGLFGRLRPRADQRAFFGLTEKYLLIADDIDSWRNTVWKSRRIPLNIQKVKIRKSLYPMWYSVWYVIIIKFKEGKPIKIRISKKVFGIDCQSENVEGFIEYLKNYEKQV